MIVHDFPFEHMGSDLRQAFPVAFLRFTHDTIDARLHFRNQQSLFKTLDELQRMQMSPHQLDEPLDVCLSAKFVLAFTHSVATVDGSVYERENTPGHPEREISQDHS